MVPARNKAKRPSLVNHTTKKVHHHHHPHFMSKSIRVDPSLDNKPIVRMSSLR